MYNTILILLLWIDSIKQMYCAVRCSQRTRYKIEIFIFRAVGYCHQWLITYTVVLLYRAQCSAVCVCVFALYTRSNSFNKQLPSRWNKRQEGERKRGHVTDFFYCHAPLLVLFKFTRLVLQLTFNWLIKNLTKCCKRRSRRRRENRRWILNENKTRKRNFKLGKQQAPNLLFAGLVVVIQSFSMLSIKTNWFTQECCPTFGG